MLGTLLLAEWIALVGGEVHTLVPGAAAGPTGALAATVLVRDGLVHEVVPAGEAYEEPERYRVVDATGKHVVPGLIDGLAYYHRDHDALYLSAGVTLVCDHGNNLADIFNARAARGDGPGLFICGAVIDGLPPTTNEALSITSPDGAPLVLDPLIQEGVDFIGVQAELTLEPWRKVVELAHAADLQVWGPLPRAVTFEELLEAGQDGLLFLDALLPQGYAWDGTRLGAGTESAEELDSADFLALFAPNVARVKAAGTRIVPVIRGHARLLEDPGESAPILALLGPQFAARWSRELELRRGQIDTEYSARGKIAIAHQRMLVAELARAGVALVPSSGAPHPWLTPGEGLHNELAEWSAAGIPAAELLEYATAGNARAFHIEDRGRIAAGRIADLLVVSGDPSADIAVLRRPDIVVLRGQVVERERLDARLDELRARMAKERALAERPIEVPEPEAPEGEVLLAGLAETRSDGVRSAAERWKIVRVDEQTLTFCGRRIVPRGLDQAPVDIELTQTLVEKGLQTFSIRMRTEKHELVVRGMLAGGHMRVERRVDGRFLDNKVAQGLLAAVDVGSVTTPMMLAHTRRPSRFDMLRFHEGLELEGVYWKLDLLEDGAHLFSTPQGPRLAVFSENGALASLQEQRGSGFSETLNKVDVPPGSPGLALPEATLRALGEAAARTRAAAAEASTGDGER